MLHLFARQKGAAIIIKSYFTIIQSRKNCTHHIKKGSQCRLCKMKVNISEKMVFTKIHCFGLNLWHSFRNLISKKHNLEVQVVQFIFHSSEMLLLLLLIINHNLKMKIRNKYRMASSSYLRKIFGEMKKKSRGYYMAF